MNHDGITIERWRRYTLPQQILQIAAEMHRAQSSFTSRDHAYLGNCYERALRLVDLTIAAATSATLRKELSN